MTKVSMLRLAGVVGIVALLTAQATAASVESDTKEARATNGQARGK